MCNSSHLALSKFDCMKMVTILFPKDFIVILSIIWFIRLFLCNQTLKNRIGGELEDFGNDSCKHMSNIIKEYSQELDGPIILMVDEVLPLAPENDSGDTTIFDWTSLEVSPKVDLFMAVSPAPLIIGGSVSSQVIPPFHPTILSHQLLEGHRNFAQLNRLLSCLKHHNKVLPGEKN